MVTKMRSVAARALGDPIEVETKVGRNEPCPCESGRKFKKCCGKGPFDSCDPRAVVGPST